MRSPHRQRALPLAIVLAWLAPGCRGIDAALDTTLPKGPRVLCVQAHPDDETTFAAALYKITTHLDGVCDVLLITNGEGGFKYSTLAERIYGAELTDEAVGRELLPAIRYREMRAGANLLGIRRVDSLKQTDHRYSQDPEEVLAADAGVWDLDLVARELDRALARDYDFVFTLAPTAATHGHHQAATILALEAVARMPVGERPAVLCARVLSLEDADGTEAPGLDAYPLTRVHPDAGPFDFDRTQPFGHRERLDYRIVVNWVIAEHKSQGTMQLAMSRGELERFWLFDLDVPGAEQRTSSLFARLAEPQFEARTYGPSAGTNAGSR